MSYEGIYPDSSEVFYCLYLSNFFIIIFLVELEGIEPTTYSDCKSKLLANTEQPQMKKASPIKEGFNMVINVFNFIP